MYHQILIWPDIEQYFCGLPEIWRMKQDILCVIIYDIYE